MRDVRNFRCAILLLALCAFVAGCATPAPSRPVDSDLLAAGFKVLVAQTPVQEDWVRNLKPGVISPMQRTGKKYFVYPDAAKKQIYVAGPREYDAYVALHPEMEAALPGSGMGSYVRQSDAMRKATARDLSDPFLGVGWADLIW